MLDNSLYYILLNEIQFVPDFSEVLNSLLQLEHVDVYVTGSNSRFLSSDILTEFRRRGDEIRIYPLSFAEYVTGYDGTKEDAFKDYVIFGGGLNEFVLQRKVFRNGSNKKIL